MNYHAHYDRLVERARDRSLSGYSERHHIIPKCMGGGNERVNIVRLTPEEHYLAHLLLVQMHPGNHRLLWAAMNMTGGSARQHRGGNKLYGWLRRRFGAEMSRRNTGHVFSAETRAKMSACKLGKKRNPHTAETKAKMSRASIGRKKSPDHIASLSKAKIGNRNAAGHVLSMESIAKISASKRGHQCHQAESYRLKQSANMTRIWAERRVEI